MSVGSVSTTSTTQSYNPLQQARVASRDRDGDNDNDATESAAVKAKESAKPVKSNLGNTVNITV